MNDTIFWVSLSLFTVFQSQLRMQVDEYVGSACLFLCADTSKNEKCKTDTVLIFNFFKIGAACGFNIFPLSYF